MNTAQCCPKALRVALAVSAFVLTGCQALPKTSALKDIHESYREEFSELFVSESGEKPGCIPQKASADAVYFARTREGIRSFRVKYGTESAESQHLTVLEGMMHLQVGNVGTAALLKDRVEEAKPKLASGTGHLTRDLLFAENYADLTSGWTRICDFEKRGASAVEATQEEVKTLEAAADSIAERLRADRDQGKLAEPAVDQGAVYLATSAAIFDVWAAKARFDHCVELEECRCADDPEDECGGAALVETVNAECEGAQDRLACERTKRTAFSNEKIRAPAYKSGRELIGLFLDDTEKLVADCSGATGATSPARRRYVAWYRFLGNEIEKVTASRPASTASDGSTITCPAGG